MQSIESPRSPRQSNFELMRILAMLMIVSHHLCVHGVQHVLDLESAYQAWNSGSLANKLVASFFFPGGGVGVALFFMLTGYFLFGKQRTSILKVSLETIFYGIALSVLFVALVFCHHFFGLGYDFPSLTAVKKISILLRFIFVPVSCGGWWFVTAYILLVLCAPLINAFLAKLNKSGFLLLLVLTWFFWYSCQIVLGGAYSSLGKAFFFYLFGSYYRLCPVENRHKALCTVIAIAAWTSLWLLAFFSDKIDLQKVSVVQAVITVIVNAIKNCVLLPLCAWCIFSLFARLNVRSNRFINTVAATTFGVYLIHDSSVGRDWIWNSVLKVSDVQFFSPYFPLIAVADIFGVFIACSVIDYLRLRFIEPKLMHYAKNLTNRFSQKYMQIQAHLIR